VRKKDGNNTMSKIELLHVYVLQDEHDTVKIGIADNVAKCIKAIDHATAYQITNQYESPSCVNARKIEKAAHKHFADRRKKGEWFDVSFDEAVDFVKGHFVDTTQSVLSKNVEPQTEITIGKANLPILVYNNQRVVTFALVDTVHQRPEGTASRNFRENRKHFIEGNDFYHLNYQEVILNDDFRRSNIQANKQTGLIILTQMGYLMVVKSLKDDLAWQVQRQLVDRYFAPVQSQLVSLTPEIEACIAARIRDEVTNALAKPITPKPQREVHGSRYQVHQAIANGAETLKEIVQATGISYDALKKLIQRMGSDGEIKRTKVGKRLKLSAL